ncbi:protein of unknown function [Azospirillum baldaniorum]|uniref:Uncharacterized protein n=1 Tax=Azospirillum baldaniorum TaxID=1064539 RepID=A0A9P1JMQ6_9PROT|nr:protein of unknown function [Azospirillum baldaniorum]
MGRIGERFKKNGKIWPTPRATGRCRTAGNSAASGRIPVSHHCLGGIGGAEEDRTPDLRIANASLSQLSYGPTHRYRRAADNGDAEGACQAL